MQIEYHQSERIHICGITGRLDSLRSPILEQRLDAMISAGQTPLVIDCSGLEYLSSAGLRVFLAAQKKITISKARMAICSASKGVKEIFEISGFLAIIEFHADRAAAVRSLS
jgi:anti-anti-sigma factor